MGAAFTATLTSHMQRGRKVTNSGLAWLGVAWLGLAWPILSPRLNSPRPAVHAICMLSDSSHTHAVMAICVTVCVQLSQIAEDLAGSGGPSDLAVQVLNAYLASAFRNGNLSLTVAAARS